MPGVTRRQFPCPRLNSSTSEVEFQGKLDKSRITGALYKSKLRSTELQWLRLFTDLTRRFEHWVHVIPDIEEFSAEFEVRLYTRMEKFENGELAFQPFTC